MECAGDTYPAYSYKEYRNRTVKKHLDKVKNKLRQIRECSLNPDKVKLKRELIKLME